LRPEEEEEEEEDKRGYVYSQSSFVERTALVAGELTAVAARVLLGGASTD